MKLDKYIGELLYKHDCVMIPGFGGFVANPSPARILPVSNTFLPPAKDILFNANLKKNDGLLANYISYTERISFTEALNLIHREVEVYWVRLKSGNTLQLKNIGTLTMNGEGSLQFEPDQTINYLEDSFGLTPFISPLISRQAEQFEKQFADRKPAIIHKLQPRTLRWAAVVTPLLAISLWGIFNTGNVKDFYTSHSSLMPAFLSRTEVTSPKPVSKTKIKVAEASVIPISSSDASEETSDNADLKYFIIGGAFQVKDNAEKFVDRLNANGHHAAILDQTKTGLYRVSVDGFSTMDEASRQLHAISSEIHASAWILTK